MCVEILADYKGRVPDFCKGRTVKQSRVNEDAGLSDDDDGSWETVESEEDADTDEMPRSAVTARIFSFFKDRVYDAIQAAILVG